MTPETPAAFPNHQHLFSNQAARSVFAVLLIVACLWVVWMSASLGFSRLMSRYAILGASLPAANAAVRLTPHDAESRRARGAVLRYLGEIPEAVKEYEAAVSLRPLDDLLWSELGIVREELGDNQGALSALNESVQIAPFYALPRWQRGNVLLRMGHYDEGFADLRRAAASDHELLPSLLDLAWGLSKFVPKLTEQILQIDNDQTRLSFARFLARRGLGAEAVEQLRQVGSVPEQIRKEMVSHLITSRSFSEAFEIWSKGASPRESGSQPALFDGGFELPLSFEETGFGWRVAGGEGVSLSVDQAEKQSGAKSLRIQFSGQSNPGIAVVSKLIMVKPLKRYRLSFSSRTQDLTTGGLPVITISAATSERIIGKGPALQQGTNEWNVQSAEFTVAGDENAVVVSLRRENCATTPCPIFGVVWLDSFSIEELNVSRETRNGS